MKTAFIVSLASAGFSSVAIAASANPVAHVLVDNSKSSTTIFVPLGTIYTDEKVLATVSKLSLVDLSGGQPLNTITCQAYKDTEATEPAGNAFTSTAPALLSTNSVQVGSIKCLSSDAAKNTTSTDTPSTSVSVNGTATSTNAGVTGTASRTSAAASATGTGPAKGGAQGNSIPHMALIAVSSLVGTGFMFL
ncbi:hypothetical protein GQ53DRAFT_863764 [Thozetella sp. PMI_491]|nr:hypothetical protein GQ53DRAFT_863764 [Thozetella sp. PMI_491]